MGRTMTRKIRLTILAFSIACFFIVAPLAILYGSGYRYDLKNKTFIQTGAIYLKSVPSKARVIFNKEEWKKKTPLIIDGLLPKKYPVEVKLEGFHSWQKVLEVKPALVTEAKNILLIQENPLITALENKSEIEVREFLLSPNKKELVFSFYQQDESAGIWIINLSQKDKVTLIDNKLLALPANYIDFTPLGWSADSNKLLFSSRTENNKEQFFIVDLENLAKTILEPPEEENLNYSTSLKQTNLEKKEGTLKNTGILNLGSIIKEKPLKFRWHEKNSNLLLWLARSDSEPLEKEALVKQAELAETKKESTLFQLDLSDYTKNKTFKIIAKEVIDFVINQNNIYIIKKIPQESALNQESTPNQRDISINKYIIYKNNFELTKFPEELGIPKKLFVLEKRGIAVETQKNRIYLLLLQDNNPLLNNNPSFFLLTKGAKEVKLSPDKNKILYWQEDNLKIYFLQKNLSYKKEVGDVETINLDSPAKQVLWYKDSEHLIYTQNGTIRIIEIDPRDKRNDMVFTEAEILIYQPNKNLLYFINKGNLYKVKFLTKAIY